MSLFKKYLNIINESNKMAYAGLKGIILNTEKLDFANDQIKKYL